jgi:cytidylate kinase
MKPNAECNPGVYSESSVDRTYAPFIVAISGKSGCGNSTVTRLLAEALGFKVVNYTFRNMAAELGMNLADLLEVSRKDTTYDRRLDDRQVELARSCDSVVGSRLAIWKIPDASLKVYLRASDFIRSKRIHGREGGSFEEVLEKTRYRDALDKSRYLDLYGIDVDEHDFADLIVDTERIGAETVAKIVYEAAIHLREHIR